MQARLTAAEDREKEALSERNQLQSQLQTATKQLQQAQDILKDVPTAKQALENEYGRRIWAFEQEVWRLEDEARNHKANRRWVLEREMLEDKYTQLTEVKVQLVLRNVYLEQENMRLRIQTGETELSAPLQAYLLPAEWSAPYPRSWSTEDQNMWLKAGLKALKALVEQGSLLTEGAILQGQNAAFMKLKEEAAYNAMQQGAALPKSPAELFEEHYVQHEAALLAAAAEHTKPSMSEQTAAVCKQMVAQVLSLEEPSAQQALVLAGAVQHGVQSAAQQGTAGQPAEFPPPRLTASATVASPAGSTVSTIVFSSSAASSGSSTRASSGYQSTPHTSLAQVGPQPSRNPSFSHATLRPCSSLAMLHAL